MSRVRDCLVALMGRTANSRGIPAADTAICAAGCGVPVVLGESHHTIVRSTEQVLTGGDIQPVDVDFGELAYVHQGCWPTGQGWITLRARHGDPDHATLAAPPDGEFQRLSMPLNEDCAQALRVIQERRGISTTVAIRWAIALLAAHEGVRCGEQDAGGCDLP